MLVGSFLLEDNPKSQWSANFLNNKILKPNSTFHTMSNQLM